MKSNVPSIDRPPRPGVHPEGSRSWTVLTTETADVSATKIWFKRPRTGDPDIQCRPLSSEEVELLRLDYSRHGSLSGDIPDLLASDDLKDEARRRAIDLAPHEWKIKVGVRQPVTEEDRKILERLNEDVIAEASRG